MTEPAAKPALDQRGTFARWTDEKLRFSDTDQIGHVNNTVFATLSETGRVDYIRDPALPPLGQGRSWVIVRLEIDFRAELHWPARVEIGTMLLHVGRSSIHLGQGMFCGERCVATAENVLTLMDLTSRRSIPIPDLLRIALLERLAAGQTV